MISRDYIGEIEDLNTQLNREREQVNELKDRIYKAHDSLDNHRRISFCSLMIAIVTTAMLIMSRFIK